eukprot:CAMPEP_0201129996 /NCGR_PEP_ID=MMETSP0850-20130426/38526_1 /ASSEMBLY_ACC=CAM_ASM_000622 /TAXON_ID=183588 /ORGANISM="Pseudo-nitzschia fraudulenta, Strain WWA7" /LENGTH=492 /DNA_ID=CAMNT_0047399621 /DNA_START=222 /DNA_END=1700 /DNA_ORIENTATION=+
MSMVPVEPASAISSMTIGCGGSAGAPEAVESSVAACVPSGGSDVAEASPSNKKTVDRELRQPFPVKVYEMLEHAEAKQFSHIVSWNENGSGFMVHDKDHFTKEIVPHYFNLTKYKSFQRQLSLYGFQRVTGGCKKGLRYHEKLRKGELELVRQMKPVGYKPRNLARLMEQQKMKQQQQQQQQGNILTTTTTTVVQTTTTSTTMLTNDSKRSAVPPVSNAIIEPSVPHDVSTTSSTTMGNNSFSDASATSIPPVVSSNSLIKQEDHEAISLERKQQMERHNNQVHSVSPETTYHNAIHLSSTGGPNANTSHLSTHMRNHAQLHNEHQNTHQAMQQRGLEIAGFEGMHFYVMPETRDLGIDVKLKLLKEFNPASSLLQLASKYVTVGYSTQTQSEYTSTTIPETIPMTIDSVREDRPSLLEPFTDVVSTAAATSTASTIAALQAAAANAAAINNEAAAPTAAPVLLSSMQPDAALETRYIDPLDFHTISVTSRI